MALDTNGRCEHCKAIVRNPPGRRRTIEQLTATHDEVCVGLHRKQEKKDKT